MAGAPKRLRCEYLESPIGIDELRPRLSWWLDDERPAEIQTAYHILASRRPETLEEDRGDLWDSGRTESSAYLPHRVWRKAADVAATRVVEGPRVRLRRHRQSVEPRDVLRDGSARQRRLARALDRYAADGRQADPGAGSGGAPLVRSVAAGRKRATLHHRARHLRRGDQRRARTRRRTGAGLDRFRQAHPLSDVRRDSLADARRERHRRAARRRLVLRNAGSVGSPAIRRPTAVVGATRNHARRRITRCASRPTICGSGSGRRFSIPT